MKQLETPVALMVFNRPEATRRVFAAVAAARPNHLLVVADGPRPDRKGERQLCDEVRKIVSAVDWPCKVETSFSEENLGCRRRIISGLDWVFSLVEEAIILEDDCLPDPTFFPYCTELLERYRDCDQVGIIGGFNPLPQSFPLPYSYYFTRQVLIWGWATWRRTWQKYDAHLTTWPEVRKGKLLELMWREPSLYELWTGIFDKVHAGQRARLLGLSTGIFFMDAEPAQRCSQPESYPEYWFRRRSNAYQDGGSGAEDSSAELGLPLTHPPAMTDWPDYAESIQHRFTSPSLLRRLRTRIESVLSRAT